MSSKFRIIYFYISFQNDYNLLIKYNKISPHLQNKNQNIIVIVIIIVIIN